MFLVAEEVRAPPNGHFWDGQSELGVKGLGDGTDQLQQWFSYTAFQRGSQGGRQAKQEKRMEVGWGWDFRGLRVDI